MCSLALHCTYSRYMWVSVCVFVCMRVCVCVCLSLCMWLFWDGCHWLLSNYCHENHWLSRKSFVLQGSFITRALWPTAPLDIFTFTCRFHHGSKSSHGEKSIFVDQFNSKVIFLDSQLVGNFALTYKTLEIASYPPRI